MNRILISAMLLFTNPLHIRSLVTATTADSTTEKKLREPKHYIRTCFYLDFYSTPEKELNLKTPVSKKLNSYKYSQSSIGFYTPVYTNTWFRKDSVTLANFHLLIAGSILTAKPVFSGISHEHRITKTSFGLRGIYNTGKGNIWFMQIAPFFAQDNYTLSKPTGRYSSVFVFNRTVSEKFSFRIGMIRTYLFGTGFETKRNRYGLHLAIIGFRVGRFDKTHLNVQFPRNISLDFPMGKSKKTWGSVFVKPFGGLYTFSNNDSLSLEVNASQILFGRYEFLRGFRTDFNPNKSFSFFASIGRATNRSISFSSANKTAEKKGLFTPFYREKLDPSLFINVGFNFRFGKVRRSNNDFGMYDVFDLNSSYDIGDNNSGVNTNSDIPNTGNKQRSLKNIEYKDIQDLLNPDDMY